MENIRELMKLPYGKQGKVYDMLWFFHSNKKHESGYNLIYVIGITVDSNNNIIGKEIAGIGDCVQFGELNIIERVCKDIRFDCDNGIFRIMSMRYHFKVSGCSDIIIEEVLK